MEAAWPTDSQLKHVWDLIEELQTNGKLTIAKLAPRNPSLFIQCCKMWIDCHHEGQFSNDYKIFKRIPKFKEEI
jgi:hypothetical protein